MYLHRDKETFKDMAGHAAANPAIQQMYIN